MAELGQNQEHDFMTEKIKDRPVNKKKLLRRTLITAAMAVIFGMIACFTFLVLEPVFNNWLYPEAKPQDVELQEEVEEILPEDMIQSNEEEEETQAPVMETIVEKVELEISDYQKLYKQLYELAQEAEKSMVTVTGAKSDEDWFNNTYESKDQTSGFVVADNSRELLVVVDRKVVADAEDIHVTFFNGTQAGARMLMADSNTGLAVIGVSRDELDQETLDAVPLATLGSSRGNLIATPIIALGSPFGGKDSIAFGMITSNDSIIKLTDHNYQLITTDIYGSSTASGVIINLTGQVLGIINQGFNNADNKNQISALGISEVRKTVQALSNGKAIPYLGIYGTDVTAEVNAELGVPKGACVTDIAMDSPAMNAGIQRADVIVKINATEIRSFGEYVEFLNSLRADDVVQVTVMRQKAGEYAEMTFELTVE